MSAKAAGPILRAGIANLSGTDGACCHFDLDAIQQNPLMKNY